MIYRQVKLVIDLTDILNLIHHIAGIFVADGDRSEDTVLWSVKMPPLLTTRRWHLMRGSRLCLGTAPTFVDKSPSVR